MPEPGRYERWQWLLLPLVVGLGAALFAVGGMAWLTALAVASAAVGRMTPDGRATVIGRPGNFRSRTRPRSRTWPAR